MEGILEILFPHLVKLCASTKKIGASKAEATVNVIIENVPYNIYLMKQIWSACDDKNVQPRKAATLWLKTIIGKHRLNKHVFEKGEGLSLFEKCLKKGLADSNPEVRKSTRPAFWAFIRLWPERSDGILATLSEQHRKAIINETAGMVAISARATSITAAKAEITAAKAVAATKPKPSIKDAIAAKRQAAKTAKAVPEPKISTSTSTSTTASISSSSNTRPNVLTTTTRTLSSAPVRPSRPIRKTTAPRKVLSPDVWLEIAHEEGEIKRRASAASAAKGDITPKKTTGLSTPERAVTPEEAKSPSTPGSIAAMVKAAWSVPERVVTPEDAKRPLTPGTIASMAKIGWSMPSSPTTLEEAKRPITPATTAAIAKAGWSTPERAATPEEAKRPLTPGTIAAMAKAGWSTPERAATPEEVKTPPTPGTIAQMAKAGWSPKQEIKSSAPAPETPVTVLRSTRNSNETLNKSATNASETLNRSTSHASESMKRSTSNASEAPTLYSVDRPLKPIFSRKEAMARKALGELPVNEPITRPQRQPVETDIGKMSPQERWSNVERIHRRASPPARKASTANLRKQMRAHVTKLRYGPRQDTFHGIVSIVKGNWLVLDEDFELFDELLNWIIEHIEHQRWDTILADPWGGDHNTQTILVLRALLANHCSLLSTYFPRILCALLWGARNQDHWTHMQPALEQTIEEMVRECTVSDLEDSIDAVLDILETLDIEPDPQVISLGLYTLKKLMKRTSCVRMMRPEDQEQRLAALAGRFCNVIYPDIRRTAVKMLMQYRVFLENDERFWQNVKAAGPNCERLVNYYYEKERLTQKLETERLIIQKTFDDEVVMAKIAADKEIERASRAAERKRLALDGDID